jgi:uncharacterized protein (DUF2141 family)
MKKVLFAMLAVSLLIVAGCDKTVPVTVTNSLGDWDISAVYIYPATQVSRGEDLLVADLSPDSSSVFRVLPGAYNILVIDEDDDCYIYNNVTIPAEGYTLEVTLDDLNSSNYNVGTGHYPLVITNAMTDYDVWYVYVDPVGTQPTTEYMGSGILFTGETITVWLEPGDYAVQVVDDSDATYTFETVTVAETGGALSVTDADIDTPRPAEQPATVTVVNGLGSWTINYIYIDKSDEPWGEDRLGASVLAPGETASIEITTGTWDMKAEDEDGDTYTVWGQEIGPEGYTWTVTLDQMDTL